MQSTMCLSNPPSKIQIQTAPVDHPHLFRRRFKSTEILKDQLSNLANSKTPLLVKSPSKIANPGSPSLLMRSQGKLGSFCCETPKVLQTKPGGAESTVLEKSGTALPKLVSPNHKFFAKRSQSPQTSDTSESARRSSQIEVRVICKERESAGASLLNLTLRQHRPKSKSPNVSKGPRDVDLRERRTGSPGSPLIKIIGSGSQFLVQKSPKRIHWKPNMRWTHRDTSLSESNQNSVSIIDAEVRRHSTSGSSGTTERTGVASELRESQRCFNTAGFEEGEDVNLHDSDAPYIVTQPTQWKKKASSPTVRPQLSQILRSLSS